MLRKKAPGRVRMDAKLEVMVWRMDTPLAAFSMIALGRLAVSGSSFSHPYIYIDPLSYRSMTVMTGHVKAPAIAALVTSTPNRIANRSVFHAFFGDTTGTGTGVSWARRRVIVGERRGRVFREDYLGSNRDDSIRTTTSCKGEGLGILMV